MSPFSLLGPFGACRGATQYTPAYDFADLPNNAGSAQPSKKFVARILLENDAVGREPGACELAHGSESLMPGGGL